MIDPDGLYPVNRAYRTYRFTIYQDLRRWRLFPFWATGSVGIMKLGYGGGVWRARSRKRLVEKLVKWAKRDALRNGLRDPIIKFEDAR